MNRSFPRIAAAALLAIVGSAACSSATGRAGAPATTRDQATPSPANQAGANAGRTAYAEADVHFMSGMIPHHAQAVKIAGWAATHASSNAVRILCERIVVGQRDEIALMRTWLMDGNQPVPDSNATHLKMKMDGVEHDMLMPGMLNDEELAQLDRARGTDFDRLFLTFMIRHHEGAVTMVDQLFASYGAAQDELVFRLASDIYADQTTEIDRMQKMLTALPAGGRRP